MNSFISLKRNNTANIIAFNPSTITITRVTRTFNTDTGGMTEVETMYEETVRVTKVNNNILVASENIGIQQNYNGAIILASYDSEFSEDMNSISDTFTYDSLAYKVTSVMNNKEKDEITSKQVVCEVL